MEGCEGRGSAPLLLLLLGRPRMLHWDLSMRPGYARPAGSSHRRGTCAARLRRRVIVVASEASLHRQLVVAAVLIHRSGLLCALSMWHLAPCPGRLAAIVAALRGPVATVEENYDDDDDTMTTTPCLGIGSTTGPSLRLPPGFKYERVERVILPPLSRTRGRVPGLTIRVKATRVLFVYV